MYEARLQLLLLICQVEMCSRLLLMLQMLLLSTKRNAFLQVRSSAVLSYSFFLSFGDQLVGFFSFTPSLPSVFLSFLLLFPQNTFRLLLSPLLLLFFFYSVLLSESGTVCLCLSVYDAPSRTDR